MKKAKHKDRKSFKKWAMPDQRVETETMSDLNKRRAKSKRPYMVGR